MDEDDLIWVEEINGNEEEKPLIYIYNDPRGGISFKSILDPLGTARVLIGLAHHIMENHVG
jgi:hypothetical protein